MTLLRIVVHLCVVQVGLPRGKLSLESWFKDLSGTKPLTQLAKKVISCVAFIFNVHF